MNPPFPPQFIFPSFIIVFHMFSSFVLAVFFPLCPFHYFFADDFFWFFLFPLCDFVACFSPVLCHSGLCAGLVFGFPRKSYILDVPSPPQQGKRSLNFRTFSVVFQFFSPLNTCVSPRTFACVGPKNGIQESQSSRTDTDTTVHSWLRDSGCEK